MEFCCIKKINWNYVSVFIGLIIIGLLFVILIEYNKYQKKENNKYLYDPNNITVNNNF
jgi:phosphatidylglycerophosphatase A